MSYLASFIYCLSRQIQSNQNILQSKSAEIIRIRLKLPLDQKSNSESTFDLCFPTFIMTIDPSLHI